VGHDVLLLAYRTDCINIITDQLAVSGGINIIIDQLAVSGVNSAYARVYILSNCSSSCVYGCARVYNLNLWPFAD